MSDFNEKLEPRIRSLGEEIFKEARQTPLAIFNPQVFYGKLIDWAMQDEAFKVSLFRFVDVLPTLNSSEAIIRHAQEYFSEAIHKFPGLLKWGFNINPNSLAAKAAAPVIKKQVKSIAENFIVGDSPKESLKAIRKIRKKGRAFTIDLLGDATVNEVEAVKQKELYIELLNTLAQERPNWEENAPLIENHLGEQTTLNISVKLSALYSQVRPVNLE